MRFEIVASVVATVALGMLVVSSIWLGWSLRPVYPALVYPARVVIYAPPVEMERTEQIEELLMQYTLGHDAGKQFMTRVVTESMVRVSE